MPETITEPRLSKAASALAGHLDRVRRRQCGVALHTGIAMALAALLAWLAIEMPLDWLLALHVQCFLDCHPTTMVATPTLRDFLAA